MIFSHAAAYSQNLIANGSFEDENICTEYIKNCAPEGWIATSLTSNYYFLEPQWAADGIHFVGVIVGHLTTPVVRNFVCSRLLCGLRKGNSYRIEFWLRSRHDVLDSIGVLFTTANYLYDKRSFKVHAPQLLLRDTARRMTKEWQRYTMQYTATGEENFITIGSFKKNDYRFRDRPDDNWHYYFFVDNIRIIPLDPNEGMCADAAQIKTSIYDENERHSLLEKKKYLYSRTPPPIKKASVTTIRTVDTLIIPDILFASASYALQPSSHTLLDEFYERIKNKVIDSLIVEGHTDSIGSVAYNDKLSLNRAKAVAEYVTAKFQTFSKPVETRGYANRKPVASNATASGRQQNRRVELYLFSKE
jgi:outer membrane protein OmpA-like peptidoglycan-associated protein